MTRFFVFALSGAVLAGCTSFGGTRPTQSGPRMSALLYAECATAAVVGLRWQAPRGPVAHYEITRDGAPLATTTDTSFADTTVSASSHYSYSVFAVPRWGADNIIASTEVDTAAASPNGDAPYCRSKYIE